MNTEVKKQQLNFHAFTDELMKIEHIDLLTYQSVIGMVYSLIEDKHLISLNRLLKETYPEYYAN